MATFNDKSMHMPERVVSLEAAVGGHYVAAFLNGRFSLSYCDIVEMKIMGGE